MGGFQQGTVNEFIAAQSVFNTPFTPSPTSGQAIITLFTNNTQRIPLFLRTGPKGCGSPNVRKTFKRLTIFGRGSVAIRVYVDGRLVINQAIATASGADHGHRAVNFPRGTEGYVVDIEIAGDYDPRMMGVEYTKS